MPEKTCQASQRSNVGGELGEQLTADEFLRANEHGVSEARIGLKCSEFQPQVSQCEQLDVLAAVCRRVGHDRDTFKAWTLWDLRFAPARLGRRNLQSVCEHGAPSIQATDNEVLRVSPRFLGAVVDDANGVLQEKHRHGRIRQAEVVVFTFRVTVDALDRHLRVNALDRHDGDLYSCDASHQFDEATGVGGRHERRVGFALLNTVISRWLVQIPMKPAIRSDPKSATVSDGQQPVT